MACLNPFLHNLAVLLIQYFNFYCRDVNVLAVVVPDKFTAKIISQKVCMFHVNSWTHQCEYLGTAINCRLCDHYNDFFQLQEPKWLPY